MLQNMDNQQELLNAAISGDLQTVFQLIRFQRDLDIEDGQGRTPLYIAASAGNSKIVSELIRAQANVDVQTASGESPLLAAIQRGHSEVVEALIAAGADVNCHSGSSKLESPIFMATKRGDKQMVSALLRARANADFQKSALVLAVKCRYHGIVRDLIGAHCDVNQKQMSGVSSVHMAAYLGDFQSLRILAEAFADCSGPRDNGESSVYIASLKGHFKAVEELVKAGVDVNIQKSSGQTAVYVASEYGHLEVAKLLIKAGADVCSQDSKGCSAIWVASQNGHGEIVDTLIKAQVDVDAQNFQGVTPLYLAAQNGHHKVVALLIGAQAQVDLATNKNEVPLIVASHNGHHKVVKMLVGSRANTDIQQYDGATPIQIASLNGHQTLVKTLIRAGANLNLQDQKGASALLVASQNGHRPVVQMLIESGADVNIQTNEGMTPLYMASYRGLDGIADALINGQADVNKARNTGSSPLYIASQNGHRKTVECLIKAIADVSQPNNTGMSAPEIASRMGHKDIEGILVRARDGTQQIDDDRFDLAHFANLCMYGKVKDILASIDHYHQDNNFSLLLGSELIRHLLDDCKQLRKKINDRMSFPVSDYHGQHDDPSLKLHSAMLQSGFTQTRASLQSATADILEQILREIHNMKGIFIVGSFSEGWGNSLVRLDGKTDIDSDIDVTQFYDGSPFHLEGRCSCMNADAETTLKYTNGHMKWTGTPANPARQLWGSSLKPAVDSVRVRPCCCYPLIQALEPGHATQMPEATLKSLSQELAASSCHLATAAPPGEEGNYLRVSTTFLERRLMRSLTDVQGQLFIVLKYLIKKVISAKVTGLKSYHAKSLLFYMIEEQPADSWEPKNLVTLTRAALQKLLNNLEQPGSVSGECMRHFFMRDAIVYLKKGTNETVEITKILRETMENLEKLLIDFGNTLLPLQSSVFYFHPFLVLPDIAFEISLPEENDTSIEYHQIYQVVTSLIGRLANRSDTYESLIADIDRIPSCAQTARDCLRVMACLQQERFSEAIVILKNTGGRSVSRGIRPEKNSTAPDLIELVWRHLKGHDSAWKFFIRSERKLEFHFLPERTRKIFPLQMRNYFVYFYINFDAFLRCLRMELLIDRLEESHWFEELMQSEDVDAQELLVALHYCTDLNDLVFLIQAHGTMIEQYPELLRATEYLFMSRPSLKEAACASTLNEARERLLKMAADADT